VPTFVVLEAPEWYGVPFRFPGELPREGVSATDDLLQAGNMPPNSPLSPPPPDAGSLQELEYLYAQRAAVEALIRALEAYREFSPRLVTHKTKTA
jgi:hypothetical protein